MASAQGRPADTAGAAGPRRDRRATARQPSAAPGERADAVLRVLQDAGGAVVSRRQLAALAGMDTLNPRRVDAVVAQVRRDVGADCILTVRGRGWRWLGPASPA